MLNLEQPLSRAFENVNRMQVIPTPFKSAPLVYSFARVAPTQ